MPQIKKRFAITKSARVLSALLIHEFRGRRFILYLFSKAENCRRFCEYFSNEPDIMRSSNAQHLERQLPEAAGLRIVPRISEGGSSENLISFSTPAALCTYHNKAWLPPSAHPPLRQTPCSALSHIPHPSSSGAGSPFR